jgi:alcohol dehydrogenase YqhD (iron-dependent ADH family)
LKRLNWNEDSQFKDSVFTALDYLCTITIRKAIESSGVEDMIAKIAGEYISSDEYQALLKERVVQSIKTTTLYVKPELPEI